MNPKFSDILFIIIPWVHDHDLIPALIIHPNIFFYRAELQTNIDYILNDFVKPVRYKRNVTDFLLMFQFIMLYIQLMMSFFKNSYYYSDSAQRFAARINFNHSLIVAIKFYILYYKKTFMVFLIVNTIIFFGFLLKVNDFIGLIKGGMGD